MSFFLAIALTTISCSKDEDAEKSIEGKWIFAQTGSIVDSKEVLVNYPHTAECTKDYTVLNGGNGTDFTFNKFENSCKEETKLFTYTRNGAEFTRKRGDGNETYKILNLTDSELKLSYTEGSLTAIIVFTKG